MDNGEKMVGQSVNKSDRTEYRVGTATQITLIQVRPGHEVEIAQRLASDYPETTVYKLFGDADLGMVQRMSDHPSPVMLHDDIRKNIMDIQTIVCFNWEGFDSIEYQQATNVSCMGICLLKANSDFLRTHGITGEHLILRAIRGVAKSQQDVHVGVYGSLGWFEILLLIYGSSINEVLLFANALRHAFIRSPINGQTKVIPCFETSKTIPAVICKNGIIPPNIIIEPGLSLELRVSCYSWADSFVYAKLFETFKTRPYYVAGTDDFALKDIRLMSLSDYVEKLWNFRRETSENVYSTNTTFRIRARKERAHRYPSAEMSMRRLKINFDDQKFVSLSKYSPTTYAMLVDVYAKINDFLVDFQRRSIVANLLPFAEELLETIKKTNPNDYEDNSQDVEAIGHMLESLYFGLQQRATGVEISTKTWFYRSTEIGGSGGIQRVLLALSSLPTAMLKELNYSWQGFSVFGWAPTYKRYVGGVINMPTEAVYRPEMWFGIFHEVGHEYCSQLDLANDTRIVRALENQDMYSEENSLDVTEIFSEIFACKFGFDEDFEKCFSTTWPYLVNLIGFREKSHAYFLRFLLTYIFIVETHGSKYISKKKQFLSAAKELREKILSLSPKTEISDALLNEVSEKARRLRIVIDVIKDLMPSNKISPLSTKYPELLEGKIPENIESPLSIIKYVSNKNMQLSFRQEVAIILALWNFQIKIKRN